ncbi:MAG: STAS domain-containing protein [Ilumatobacteraceae bacterium]
MSSPLIVASTDATRQLVMLTVEGSLSDAEQVESLRLVLPVVPAGHSFILDLSETTELGQQAIQALRSVARDAAGLGVQMIIVCGDLVRRSELVLADIDSLVPVVEALEHALPLTRAAA